MGVPDARYMIMVPTVDNLGNQLVNVAAYAHQFLFQNFNNQGSWIDPGKVGMWRDDAPEKFDHLVTVAEETPEMDSAIKQLAAYVADVCNQWGVLCIKEGKNGPVRWEISNPEYKPGQPAEEIALADPQTALRHDPSMMQAAPSTFGGDQLPA